MTTESTHPDLYADADPRIYVTEPDMPEDGRTFVWALTRWFERIEGDSGAVEFSPVAWTDEELRDWLRETDEEMDELDLDNEFAATVREEFLNQTPLVPEAPELSDQSV